MIFVVGVVVRGSWLASLVVAKNNNNNNNNNNSNNNNNKTQPLVVCSVVVDCPMTEANSSRRDAAGVAAQALPENLLVRVGMQLG